MGERLCASLHSAMEKLRVAETDIPPTHGAHRNQLALMIETVERLGTFYCPQWSRFDVPLLPDNEATS